jgi:hypothetical protein
MLSVGIAQHPVPGFRLTEERVGRVRDSTSQASCQGASAPLSEGGGPTEKPGLRGEGFKRAEISNKFLSLQPHGSLCVLFQGSIQLVNQTHEFYGVKFFAGLFCKLVPIGPLRSH